ncbi:MAG TPA: hypothetical protein PKI62_13865 [bacterium]|nr:hypothetical protein [bacterium]HPR87788.1 hypothetical protein [bacterium]
MIIDLFANAELYFRLRPAFARACEFLADRIWQNELWKNTP